MSRMKYFEDYSVGVIVECRPFSVSEAEILDFAKQFDPQPFHVDREAAAQSHFGGIIASGFHTCALVMRSLVGSGFFGGSSMGSPGLDEIRWRRPVRAGETLRVKTEVLDAKRSRSKPDRGVVRHRVELLNDRDQPVMSYIAMSIFPTRTG
jgi:acyl dehydratase